MERTVHDLNVRVWPDRSDVNKNIVCLITETYRPCLKVYDGCIKRFVDEAYIKPPSNADGSLNFPNDFFNRVCG